MLKRSVQKTNSNEIGGAKMVALKRRDPLIYAGVKINFCNNLPIEQVISNFILLEKNRCNKFRGCLTLEKNL